MKIYEAPHLIVAAAQVPATVATIGVFDGVHRGHCCLLAQVAHEARQRGLRTMAVTFDQSPAHVLGHAPAQPQLTDLDEKVRLLLCQADYVAVLPFTRELAALSARDFMARLHDELHVRALVIGYDHRFGHDRNEGFGDYVAHGRALGLDVLQAHQLTDLDGVSSSSIRRLLADGQIDSAAHLLGRPYTFAGTVEGGHRVGRTMGYPTANIRPLYAHQLVPASGVYAVGVQLLDTPDTPTLPAALNIGTRPTLDNGSERTIEAHLLDFEGDLYGQRVRLHFHSYLRPEQRFDTIEALRRQISDDAATVRQLLNS